MIRTIRRQIARFVLYMEREHPPDGVKFTDEEIKEIVGDRLESFEHKDGVIRIKLH